MSLKKKLKKVGKAAAVAGAAYLASKAMSGAKPGINVDKGRGSALSNMYRKKYSDGIMRGVKGTKAASIGIMDRIGNAASKVINMGPGKNATSKKGGTLANKILSGNTFGLDDMGGAKAGGMMKASTGTYVKAKCKLGRNKKTLIT
jgi:hypothetical protein